MRIQITIKKILPNNECKQNKKMFCLLKVVFFFFSPKRFDMCKKYVFHFS